MYLAPNISLKRQHNFRFQNWARNAACLAEVFFQPESEMELQRIVQEAMAQRKRIRVVGAGHSWSPVACSDEYLVNLDRFQKVLGIDREKKRIRVQAGIRLKQLNAVLEQNGLALVQLGSVSEQSIAGATATGTHGTGITFKVLSSAIVAMRVVTGSGAVRVLEEDDAQLDAFRLSAGMLGIVSEITLQCTAAFSLREHSSPMRFDDALDSLPALLKQNHHVKFWWFPHVDELMCYRYERTQEVPQQRNAIGKWLEDVFVAQGVFPLLLRLGNLFPEKIPAINRAIKPLHQKEISRVGKSYELFNVPMPPRHRESEYAIPVEQTADALRDLRSMIAEQHLYVNFVVEVRFVQADTYWISPAYARNSCFLGGYFYGDTRWQSYFQLFERLMLKYHGRPHWGKEFTPALHNFEKMYERWNDFHILKTQTDPQGLFSNTFMDTIFKQN